LKNLGCGYLNQTGFTRGKVLGGALAKTARKAFWINGNAGSKKRLTQCSMRLKEQISPVPGRIDQCVAEIKEDQVK